ncbi:NIMA interactive protein [Zymoseptoria brevis]|uniref:NIMA interactive protein n=1 Tax=Zymoseptoria brevis TaxID=1047168 RepID=A0A0F4GEB2_9PEZI|nr:NIMA interactive protein [Zymoseptoria brevis]
MDHESLRTASTYLNNLLLARGLLRNGDPIDFVKPSKESRAQIINLVHDLILREDRDKEQREQVATTIRTLRSEDARKIHDIERLTTKGEELARAAAQAQAAERHALGEVKKIEKAMKLLQDQTAKLKTTLAQVKTQCINDVRKRDLELARLKTHLQGQQRGTRVGTAAPSMSVRKASAEQAAHDLTDPEYSLKQETTEFLTQLSQSLSDENDSLIGLIRTSLSTLKDVLGLPANVARQPDSAVGSMGSDAGAGKSKVGDNLLLALPTSYEALVADMDGTLSHLKTILTNPNFVSVEEVEIREEEIARLREGWEHMERRWRDVLNMMEGWLRRMDTGDTINIDDLRRGMGLVSPTAARMRGPRPAEMEIDQSLVDSETSEIALPDIQEESFVSSSHRPSNRPMSSPKRKRDALEPPEFFDLRPATSRNKAVPGSPAKSISDNAHLLLEDDESEELEVPQMTIAEKLSAAQEEAEQAAADAQSKPSTRVPASVPAISGRNGNVDEEKDDDTLGKLPGDATLGKIFSPIAKKTRIKGRPRKRKSTLSPDELEALIGANEE